MSVDSSHMTRWNANFLFQTAGVPGGAFFASDGIQRSNGFGGQFAGDQVDQMPAFPNGGDEMQPNPDGGFAGQSDSAFPANMQPVAMGIRNIQSCISF